ncbi:MAG: hypothetical protein ABIH92_03600 [Nanoarchaeota archaeon]
MRKWAFIVAILGMFVMVLFLNLEPEKVEDYSDLEELELNTRVSVMGKVVSERLIYGRTELLVLDNGIDLVFEGVGNFENEEIEVVGVVSEYNEKKQVTVEKIWIRKTK